MFCMIWQKPSVGSPTNGFVSTKCFLENHRIDIFFLPLKWIHKWWTVHIHIFTKTQQSIDRVCVAYSIWVWSMWYLQWVWASFTISIEKGLSSPWWRSGRQKTCSMRAAAPHCIFLDTTRLAFQRWTRTTQTENYGLAPGLRRWDGNPSMRPQGRMVAEGSPSIGWSHNARHVRGWTWPISTVQSWFSIGVTTGQP